jgi:outer membrane receptor protein involved in Fe transport
VTHEKNPLVPAFAAKIPATILAGVLMAVSSLASAQGSANPDAEVALEEIVVTAQKRTERLQDVPISVQAITGETLQNMGVQNFESFEVPGIRVSRGGMSDTITVRGIGSGQNLGFEQSAPMYIDGIYYGRARTQRLGFLDIEQIEVLKGPQPTFLGKNATAGAINIRTRRPGNEFEREIEVSHEPQTQEMAAFVAATLPINDRWAVRAAARYRDSEGYLTNTVTGRKEPAINDKLARLTVVGNPTEALSVTAIGYYAANLDKGRNNQSTICEPNFRRDTSAVTQDPCVFDDKKASFSQTPADIEAARPDLWRDNDGGPFLNDMEAYGTTLQLDWELANGLSVTSVTGYYQYDNYQYIDVDQGVANYGVSTFTENYDQVSQELRLLGPKDTKLQWSVGAYLDSNDNDVVSTQSFDARNLLPFTPPAVPPQTNRTAAFVTNNTNGFVQDVRESAQSMAFFGDAKYEFSNSFAIRGGLRYEEVEKDISYKRCGTLPYPTCTPVNTLPATAVTSRKDDKLAPSATLEYRPLDDVLFYLSYKKGFKSGGFSNNDAGPFNSEHVTAWEAGAKTRLLDNRMMLNLTVFQGEYDDLQVSSFDPVSNLFTTTNAASAKNKGVEAEVQYAATSRLRFAVNVSYLDAYYDDFRNSPCWAGQATLGTGCGPNAQGSQVQNLSGVVTPYAPEWSGTAAMDYTMPVGDSYRLGLGADVFYTGEFATLTDINPRAFQEAYTKLNARVAFARDDDSWEIALIARNMTDERTAAFKNTIPGGFFSVASFTDPPATYTVQARFKF